MALPSCSKDLNDSLKKLLDEIALSQCHMVHTQRGPFIMDFVDVKQQIHSRSQPN